MKNKINLRERFSLHNFSKLSKGKKLSIICTLIAVILFVVSGLSVLADDVYKKDTTKSYVKLKNAKLISTNQNFSYTRTATNIPYVVICKEDRGFLNVNKSKVWIWTPAPLTGQQWYSLRNNVLKSLEKSGETTNLTKERNANFQHGLKINATFHDMENVTGNNLKIGDVTITDTGKAISLVNKGDKEAYGYAICGLCERTDTSYEPSFGVSDAVSVVENEETVSTSSKYVEIIDGKYYSTKETFKATSTNNKIPYVVVYNNGVLEVWTNKALDGDQIASMKKQLGLMLNKSGSQYKFYNTNTLIFTQAKIGLNFTIRNVNGTYSVESNSPLTYKGYVAGHFKLSTKEINTSIRVNVLSSTTPASEAPSTSAPASEAPSTSAPASQAPSTSAPASEAPVTPVTEAPVTPVTEAPVTPVTEAPVTPVTEVPVTPVTEVPVTPVTQPPITSGGTTPVETVPVDIPVETVPVDTPVETAPVDTQVETVPVDTPVETTPGTITDTEDTTSTTQTEASTTDTTVSSDGTPKTGDKSNMVIYTIIGLLALSGIITFYVLRKRTNAR